MHVQKEGPRESTVEPSIEESMSSFRSRMDESDVKEGDADGGAQRAASSWAAAVVLARDCGWQEVVVSDWKQSREVNKIAFELSRRPYSCI